jgi:hypothetical protein
VKFTPVTARSVKSESHLTGVERISLGLNGEPRTLNHRCKMKIVELFYVYYCELHVVLSKETSIKRKFDPLTESVKNIVIGRVTGNCQFDRCPRQGDFIEETQSIYIY